MDGVGCVRITTTTQNSTTHTHIMADVYLAPMRIADREEHKRRWQLQKKFRPEEVPNVRGKYSRPCGNCQRKRILTCLDRSWCRACGVTVA